MFMEEKTNSSRKSKTLTKALLVLEAFADRKSGWGVRSLAEHLSMNPTSVHRILVTYEDFKFLIKDPESNRYELGPGSLRLASSYTKNNPLSLIANQVFNKYTDRWPYNTYLGSLSGHEVVYVTIVAGSSPIKVDVHPGERIGGLHSTALGKAILAFQSDDFINEFIETNGLVRFTLNTVTDPEELWEQIREIRKTGFSINRGEAHDHIAAIGAPIFNASNEVVASFSLVYPLLEDNEKLTRLERIVALTKDISDDISDRYLGL
jgi:DNA-binding IclR family transcriptional regulator